MTTASAFKMTVKNGGEGAGYEKPPAGNHPAVLVAAVDMGTQWNEGFQGAPGKYQRKGYFVWELVAEPVAGQPGRNHLIGCDLTLSTNEKATLRKWIEARTGKKLVDGQPLDIEAEVGQPCLLSVVLTDKGYPKITGLSGLPRGMSAPAAKTTPVVWGLDPDRLGELPDWLPYYYGKPVADTIRECREIAGDRTKPAAVDQPVPAVSANPGTGTGGTGAGRATPPPRRAAKVEPADDTRWWTTERDDAEPVERTGRQVKEWLAEHVNDPAALAAFQLADASKADAAWPGWEAAGFVAVAF